MEISSIYKYDIIQMHNNQILMEISENNLDAQQLAHLKNKFDAISQMKENQASIKIGYYPFRAKAQIIRLICQYLHISYQDYFFTPQTWQKYKKQIANKLIFGEVPFIKDNEFFVSEPMPACFYLINKYKRQDLLGKNLEDITKLNMLIWAHEVISNALSISCKNSDQQNVNLEQYFQFVWREGFAPKLKQLQKEAGSKQWFLDYLTIMDFAIEEIIRYGKVLYPAKMDEFPKLNRIYEKVCQIPEIKSYQNSNRAIRQICPRKYFEEYKAYKKFVCNDPGKIKCCENKSNDC